MEKSPFKYHSEAEVLTDLGVKNFEDLPRSKYLDLICMLPEINPDIVANIIAMAPKTVGDLRDLIKLAMGYDRKCGEGFQAACQLVLKSFGDMGANTELTPQERGDIRKDMIRILEMMQKDRYDERNANNERIKTYDDALLITLSLFGVLAAVGIGIGVACSISNNSCSLTPIKT